MSSYTQVRVVPAIPVVSETVGGRNVARLSKLLGVQGREELRKTFRSLCGEVPDVLNELYELATPAEITDQRGKLGLDWHPVDGSVNETYRIRLEGKHLGEVTGLLGTTATARQPAPFLDVFVTLGNDLATLEFQQSFLRELPGGRSDGALNPACQVLANRAFNRVLMLTVHKQLQNRIVEVRQKKHLTLQKVERRVVQQVGQKNEMLVRTNSVIRNVSKARI
jgi:hypothetical protein